MADFKQAFTYVMQHEDPKLAGMVLKDPTKTDPTAVARFGVNSERHPELVADGFFEVGLMGPTMPRDRALQIAEDTFKYEYFQHIGGYALVDQSIANKFADLAFNEGTLQATKLVQRAVAEVLQHQRPAIADDGIPGARTIAAINACEPERLLPAIKDEAKKFYRLVAQEHPQFAKDLEGWLTRVDS